MTTTTRERIIETIAQSRTVTVSDLSKKLHTTVANIRYHLDPLIEDNIIEKIPPEAGGGQRGRPASRFRLSEKSKPNDLEQLSSDLLSILMDPARSPEERATSITQIARTRSRGVNTFGKPTQRLTQAIDYLNRHAYRARWEAHRSGPEVRFGNCPFAAILPDHPELCEVDRRMLEELLNVHVSILDCYQLSSGIPAVCIFALTFTQL